MPERMRAATQLAELLKVVSHPDRIRIVEELRVEEIDVNTLHDRLTLPAVRVSQHLAILKAHRIVEERRDGRRHFYHLTDPAIADWILDGMRFLEGRSNAALRAREAVENARRIWSPENSTRRNETPQQESHR